MGLMNNLILKLTNRGYAPLEAYGIARKLATIQQLEEWAASTPPADVEEKQGWMSVRDRILHISKKSQTPEDAADSIRDILDMVPGPRTNRDRGRLRALNEALNALDKAGGVGTDMSIAETPPPGSSTPAPGNPDMRKDKGDAWSPGGKSRIPQDYGAGTTRMSKKANLDEIIPIIENSLQEREIPFDGISTNPTYNHCKGFLLGSVAIYWRPVDENGNGTYVEDGFPYHGHVSKVLLELGYDDDTATPLFYDDQEIELIFNEEVKNIDPMIVYDIANAFSNLADNIIISAEDQRINVDPNNSESLEVVYDKLDKIVLNSSLTAMYNRWVGGQFAQNTLKEPSSYDNLGYRFNQETFQNEPWFYDRPASENCKFWIDTEGNPYFWNIGSDLRPPHMAGSKKLQARGITPEVAGECYNYNIVVRATDNHDIELASVAFPELEGVQTTDGFVSFNKVAVSKSISRDQFNNLYRRSEEGEIFWRVHWNPNEYPFSDSNAESIAWGYRDKENPDNYKQKGYSCFDLPEDLYAYFEADDLPGNTPVIAFSGEEVGYGDDGEPLVIPDMKEMYWTNWNKLNQFTGFDKVAANLSELPPAFDARSIFDLMKFVQLKGEHINWEVFKSSSSSPDEELDSMLEILTELGAVQTTDSDELGGAFIVDLEQVKQLLRASEDKSNGSIPEKGEKAVRKDSRYLRGENKVIASCVDNVVYGITNNYTEEAKEILRFELEEDLDEEYIEYYALLALTKGKDTTLEDVHDAWSMIEQDADHESLIPFEDLDEDTKELDRPYLDAIHNAAEKVQQVKTALEIDNPNRTFVIDYEGNLYEGPGHKTHHNLMRENGFDPQSEEVSGFVRGWIIRGELEAVPFWGSMMQGEFTVEQYETLKIYASEREVVSAEITTTEGTVKIADLEIGAWKFVDIDGNFHMWQIRDSRGFGAGSPESHIEYVNRVEDMEAVESKSVIAGIYSTLYGQPHLQAEALTENVDEEWAKSYLLEKFPEATDINWYGAHPDRLVKLNKVAEAKKNGVMIALVPPANVVEKLKPLTDDPDNLHVTLAFIADDADEFSHDKEELIETVKTLIEEETDIEFPLKGRISGFGTFCNDDNHVLWASVDTKHLDDLRHYIAEEIEGNFVEDLDKDYGFTPHMTLKYQDEPFKEMPEMPEGLGEFEWDLDVVYGGEWEKIAQNYVGNSGISLNEPIHGEFNRFVGINDDVYYWPYDLGEHAEVSAMYPEIVSWQSRGEITDYYQGIINLSDNPVYDDAWTVSFGDTTPIDPGVIMGFDDGGETFNNIDPEYYYVDEDYSLEPDREIPPHILAQIRGTTIAKFSIAWFQKFADREDVERKAQQIFDQGGVEFVTVTPDQDRGRSLWEFNVSSTSGKTYPLYGDTTIDDPTSWIDWFDVACSCDWGRWNYDRAPDYRHLERFPCSHAMATEKWLKRNGQKEQDRAIRELETGQNEIRFEPEPETGRRPRPSDVYREQMQVTPQQVQDKGLLRPPPNTPQQTDAPPQPQIVQDQPEVVPPTPHTPAQPQPHPQEQPPPPPPEPPLPGPPEENEEAREQDELNKPIMRPRKPIQGKWVIKDEEI